MEFSIAYTSIWWFSDVTLEIFATSSLCTWHVVEARVAHELCRELKRDRREILPQNLLRTSWHHLSDTVETSSFSQNLSFPFCRHFTFAHLSLAHLQRTVCLVSARDRELDYSHVCGWKYWSYIFIDNSTTILNLNLFSSWQSIKKLCHLLALLSLPHSAQSTFILCQKIYDEDRDEFWKTSNSALVFAFGFSRCIKNSRHIV